MSIYNYLYREKTNILRPTKTHEKEFQLYDFLLSTANSYLGKDVAPLGLFHFYQTSIDIVIVTLV